MTEGSFSMNLKLQETKINKIIEDKSKNVLFEVVVKVVEYAKRFAPFKTGLLRAGIHQTPKNVSDKFIISDSVKYGSYQEFGTCKMKPQPFLRPAVRSALFTDFPKIKKKHGFE